MSDLRLRAHGDPLRRIFEHWTTGFVLGGGLVGLASFGPSLWFSAWCGIAVFAFALARCPSRWRAALGVVIGSLVLRALWFSWSFAMAEAMTGSLGARSSAIAIGLIVSNALPSLVTVAIGAVLSRGRFVPVWLPLAWAIGEEVQTAWTGLESDWLFTQVSVRPLMTALAAYGMWPTVLLWWLALACFGDAWASRRWKVASAGVGALFVLMMAPAQPAPDLSRLAGIGVAHLRSDVDLPAVAKIDADLDLVVWPETTLADRKNGSEGRRIGARLDAPLGSPNATHLIGALTSRRHETQNSALVIDGDGTIVDLRAKRALMPVFERPFMGLGRRWLAAGREAPVLSAGGRKVIPLICGEVLTRSLTAEGSAAGGELIAVMASDTYQAGIARTSWQVLAHLQLRAIEYHLPAVYASRRGRAAIIAPDGAVLARSVPGDRSGLLVYSAAAGAEDRRPDPSPGVTVLYSKASEHLRPDCPPAECVFQAIEDLPQNPTPAPGAPRTLLVSGHSAPPRYLSKTAKEMAAIVGAFQPELIVFDTCFGASAELLTEVAATTKALVVAPPRLISGRGFHYGAGFFARDASPEARAGFVHTVPPTSLFVGRPDPDAIRAAVERTSRASGDEQRPWVRQWSPTLIAVEVEPGREVVVEGDWRRIGHPPR